MTRVINSGAALPTKKTSGKINPANIHSVLHGPSGVGKSSFLAQFPDMLFFRTEDRHDHLSILEMRVKDWLSFKKAVDLLYKKRRTHKYKSVCVDTTPRIYDWCMDYMTKQMGHHPGEKKDFGSSWAKVRKEFARTIVKLTECNAGVWFVCHTKTTDMKNSLIEGEHFGVNLTPQAYEVIIPLCYTTLFMGMDLREKKVQLKSGKTKTKVVWERAMVCHPRGDIDAKDTTGKLPEMFWMSNNAKTGYQRFSKFFDA